MNKKGFTLTELLVVVVILGIISGLSIPLIRNLTVTFEKKKYQNYADSVLSAARLYNDSYSEDLFGHNEYGCAYITYDKLIEKKLIKDIEIEDKSCNSDKTYIRVIKQQDKYGYKAFVTCGKKKEGKVGEAEVTIPNEIPEIDNEACAGVNESNIKITADESQAYGYADKNRKKTTVTITSGTGLDSNIALYAKWSEDINDRSNEGFEKLSFKIKGNQKEQLLNGEMITTTSKELVTPNKTTSYYLIVRVDYLQDLYGHQWKNTEKPNDRYLTFGPFILDNTLPTITAKAYKCNSSSTKTGPVLATKTVTGAEAESDRILDLTSITNNVNGWANKENYPYGICFDFELSDNYSLKKYIWEWNAAGLTENAHGYKEFDPDRMTEPQEVYSVETTSAVVAKKLSDDGHRYARFTVKDYAGNKTTLYINLKLDKTLPRLTAEAHKYNSSFVPASEVIQSKTTSSHDTMSYDPWTKYGVEYIMKSSDNMGLQYRSWKYNDSEISDPANYQLLTNTSDTSTGNYADIQLTQENTQYLKAEGYRYARFTVRDVAGNETYMNLDVKIDRTPPTGPDITNPYLNQWRKDAYSLGVESTDTYSGIKDYHYSFDNNATQTSTNVTDEYEKWILLSDGTGKESFETPAIGRETINNEPVYIKVCDIAGNCATDSTNLKLDMIAPDKPTISNPLKKSDGSFKWSTKDFTMTISSNDLHSGIGNYQYTYNADADPNVVINGGSGDDALTKWRIEPNATTTKTSYPSTFQKEGERTVYWRVCDAVNNCSEKTSTKVKIDKTNPTCNVYKTVPTDSNDRTKGMSVSRYCYDSGSKCTVYDYTQKNVKSANNPKVESSSQNVTIKVYDNAGNEGSCTVKITSYKCNKEFGDYYIVGGSVWDNACQNHNYNSSANQCANSTGSHRYVGFYKGSDGKWHPGSESHGSCWWMCGVGGIPIPDTNPSITRDVIDWDYCYE